MTTRPHMAPHKKANGAIENLPSLEECPCGESSRWHDLAGHDLSSPGIRAFGGTRRHISKP